MSPNAEDQMIYLQQRRAEEQAKAAATSCVVRSVHTEFADAYQERLDRIEAEAADVPA